MRHFYTLLAALLLLPLSSKAQGWQPNYGGVMLQGFYWDSYDDTKWTALERQADELSQYFSLIWIPQSGNCGNHLSMGYDDLYWFNNYNSSFGTEAELRSMIAAFKAKGLGTIADVVINHRQTLSTWFDFPTEIYKGVTYQLTSTDIVADDDNGATAAEAAKKGVSLSANNDTGEGWNGMRDLDHASPNVQKTVNAYLDFLLNDLKYTGLRYDVSKGYAPRFTGLYNKTANVPFSVGEYWDGNISAVKNWVDGTIVDGAIQSAAFDFPIRYTVRDAVNDGTWNFTSGGLVTQPGFKRFAVTFVENHDTEKRSDTDQQDPVRRDTLAANAYILAMPGTPCLFLKHWKDYKSDLKQMILVRHAAGITNESDWEQTSYVPNKNYTFTVTGSKAKLRVVLGQVADPANARKWVKVAAGYHYAYYLENAAETAWVSLPSGEYDGAKEVTLTAVSKNSNARLVYTTDGTEPVATGTNVASGTKITLPVGTTTLKVGLLINGIVSSVISRTYKIADFQPYQITIHANTDNVGWTSVNYWTWGGDGTHAPQNTSWPGDKITVTKTVNGKTWFYKTFTINSSSDLVNLVLSANAGDPQTVDITGIKKDAYFEVSTDKDGTKYKVNDVTSSIPTGIASITQQPTDGNTLVDVYTTDGALVRSRVAFNEAAKGLPAGIYIIGGKKMAVK